MKIVIFERTAREYKRERCHGVKRIIIIKKGFAECQKDVVLLVLDVMLRSEFFSCRHDGEGFQTAGE